MPEGSGEVRGGAPRIAFWRTPFWDPCWGLIKIPGRKHDHAELFCGGSQTSFGGFPDQPYGFAGLPWPWP